MIEIQNTPFEEQAYPYKISVVNHNYPTLTNILDLEGDFRIQCDPTTTVITEDGTFSTDVILFLKNPGGYHSVKFPHFTTSECPIIKYEILAGDYISSIGAAHSTTQIDFDTTQEPGCVLQITNKANYDAGE